MDKRLTYDELVKLGTIRKLGEMERRDYSKFYEDAWREDLNVAKEILHVSPKWSIISGYYAMHDLTKLFLAKKGIKVSGKFVHRTCPQETTCFNEWKNAVLLTSVKFLSSKSKYWCGNLSLKAPSKGKRLKAVRGPTGWIGAGSDPQGCCQPALCRGSVLALESPASHPF